MNIEAASMNDMKSIKSIYTTVTSHLRKNGVYQWDRFYPNRYVISKDLKGEDLYAVFNDGFCIGAVVVNEVKAQNIRDFHGMIQKDDRQLSID